MNAGARTPEELDSMFEDAFLVRGRDELCALFEDGGLLAAMGGVEARGAEAIAQAAAELWWDGHVYVGGTRRVLQARGTALVLSGAALHVVRRGGDGAWRSAISLLHPTTRPTGEDP